MAERGPLVFVFNFSPVKTYEAYKWVLHMWLCVCDCVCGCGCVCVCV